MCVRPGPCNRVWVVERVDFGRSGACHQIGPSGDYHFGKITMCSPLSLAAQTIGSPEGCRTPRQPPSPSPETTQIQIFQQWSAFHPARIFRFGAPKKQLFQLLFQLLFLLGCFKKTILSITLRKIYNARAGNPTTLSTILFVENHFFPLVETWAGSSLC